MPSQSCLPILPIWDASSSGKAQVAGPQSTGIEDYERGYPRLTALISSYDRFFICRRFDMLRSRLLLLKQDQISVLEEKLNKIDESEPCPLFLGKARIDNNDSRKSVLKDIDARLAEYDQLVERTQKALSLNTAEQRDVDSLQNWLRGTGCVDRQEIRFPEHRNELSSLALTNDNAMIKFEVWVEDKLIRFSQRFRQRIARGLMLLLITLLLMMPIVICNLVGTNAGRILVVILSTISYLAILAELTNTRTVELIVAGTTYATVLIVFVSGSVIDG
ncbi:hypothetical protein LCI18_003919 [Fusarium solani-melongenae]|uniref:Uncharacterized protein n=1 Tax=Fusarium solani subsp. cucurbitae TaxID=2747967 RepID=A0ACD3YVI7_FUSSC|nr:hypothetical protein LCI18_003919 [Fusarium solani-melongenae]